MKIKLFLILPTLYVFNLICVNTNNFYNSFISSYDLSGRYTHEYHPFILKRTQESFLELENFLNRNGFTINGHKLIFGYQEDAVMPYQTSWSRQAIEDEVVIRNNAGLCLPSKNIFGFMTGFIFKDVQWVEQELLKKQPTIEHVFARPIELFNDEAVIFQKHAFGKSFDYLIKIRDNIERLVAKSDIKKLLKELVIFWSDLYVNASKTSTDEIISYQDVLFSIDYAKALSQTTSTIQKIYLGPDITYPIEILSIQKQNATANAQAFVKKIFSDLNSINDKKTVYIFCSYVDGVGKSTLLNNIKNYQKFDCDIAKYLRCDNSSSQESTIYKIKEKVFIADLPAQMSHFVIKPEGSVFVDYKTVKMENEEIEKIKKFIEQNHNELEQQFKINKLKISNEEKYLYEYENPIDQYAQNCHVLDVKNIIWIPFIFEGNYYLFNKNNFNDIRILKPFATVHSIGLKNVEPEQMLFDKGLSISMQYDKFLDDLKSKLDAYEIQEVVFVDFLSMYPRSSRENIRVNFVLQYLKKIYGPKFDFSNTFYQHRVYKEQEICYQLAKKFELTCNALALETILRWALYDLSNNFAGMELNSIDKKLLELNLKERVNLLQQTYYDEIKYEVDQYLNSERELYSQKYNQNMIYENVIRFSFEPIVEFSNNICALFGKIIGNDYLNNFWNGFDKLKKMGKNYKITENKILFEGLELDVKFKFNKNCKDEMVLKKIANLLRSQYYAILSNLLEAQLEGDSYVITKIAEYVPPLAVIPYGDDEICIVQKSLPPLDTTNNVLTPSLKFHLINSTNKAKKWGLFEQTPHCLDWTNPGTFFGIFAFGYYPFFPKAKKKDNYSNGSVKNEKVSQKNIITTIVDEYEKHYLVNDNTNFGIPVSEIFRQVETKNLWQQIKKTNKNIEMDSNDARMPAVQLWLRFIATLEMIIKTPTSKILTRKGNRKDFVATIKLLEKITLPDYFGINLKQSAFSDYKSIEPIVPWQLLD